MITESIIQYVESMESLDECTELTVNKFDISGNLLFVDLNDLKNFKNLEKLSLCNLVLDFEDLFVISSLDKLHSLALYNCELNDDSLAEFINKTNIEELLLDNTKINFNLIDKCLEKVIIKNLKINNNINCNVLDVSQALVDFNSFVFGKCSTLILSRSQFDSNEELLKLYIGKKHIIVKSDFYDSVEVEYE